MRLPSVAPHTYAFRGNRSSLEISCTADNATKLTLAVQPFSCALALPRTSSQIAASLWTRSELVRFSLHDGWRAIRAGKATNQNFDNTNNT